jgi:DNA polymerase III delta prime subunit
MENSLWVEKYRPKNLDDYTGSESIKATISKYLEQNDIQNLIFYGPAGTGKTTLAKIIVNSINCDYIYINASDERGIDTIRDKVSGFASTSSFKPLKVVILDEADFLTIQAQASLRNIIETFSRSTRFILTCNFLERVIDPLQSRCQVFKVIPPSKGEIAKHLHNILHQESVEHTGEDLKLLVENHYPDLRKMINTCQASSKDGKIVLDKQILVSSSYHNDVIKFLKKKSFSEVRQVIANANVSDFDELYRVLYERAEEYTSNIAEATIVIEEYLYHKNFRIDQEICIMACIAKLINL